MKERRERSEEKKEKKPVRRTADEYGISTRTSFLSRYRRSPEQEAVTYRGAERRKKGFSFFSPTAFFDSRRVARARNCASESTWRDY